MNDPWDVKSVRQSSQYLSCMKINGVPLLPPVLSKECRKEMQYYKLLAKEVEKRISQLKPYVIDSETESSEDKTDAPELPKCEQNYELAPEDVQALNFNIKVDKVTAFTNDNGHLDSPKLSADNSEVTKISNYAVDSDSSSKNTSKFVIDLSLSINETGKSIVDNIKSPQNTTTPIELPERDCECPHKTEVKRPNSIDLNPKSEAKDSIKDKLSFSFSIRDTLTDPITNLSLNHDGPSSLSSKSFTGSLNDIHTDSVKDSKPIPLTRQRSYTVLKPSPLLLAHLEVQSLNTGVEITSISMSESLSNLSSANKKRRSWDLESAKAKWSSMALELKQKNIANGRKVNGVAKEQVSKPIPRKTQQSTPQRARSVVQEKPRRAIPTPKVLNKSEPIQKPKKTPSPVRNNNTPLHHTGPKSPNSPKLISQKIDPVPKKPQLISESEDPATRVRELYEKIQKQQLIQMANLVEKQKREQILLQQVFEEQNNLLFTQLKTICPKSPNEIKEAWLDNNKEPADRGPVSLSQLINQRAPEKSAYESPVSSTLTDTHNYINHCDSVLKKSRVITGSIKKPQQKISSSEPREKTQSPKSHTTEGSRTRTHSPTPKNTSTSRKLTYETSLSSDRDYDPILTDRTNDTMADLNVTFPSDHSDECQPYSHNDTVVNSVCAKDVMISQNSVPIRASSYARPNERIIRSTEETKINPLNCIQTSIRTRYNVFRPPTAQECAAATTIVAYAKGYLVRRLMKTERVQSTVQTIKDALLCALQLHQDREGIRGADVDLHRRLIQQITAACYALHDTFVASTPEERCAMIAADRGRRRSLAMRPPQPQPPRHYKPTDIMSQSHSGAFPTRVKRTPTSLMTQSNYESFSGEKCSVRARYMPSPRRRPWR